MSQEIIYTSAPQGLRPGSFGFCTVATTPGMTSMLAERLEAISGYRHVYPPGDPKEPLNPVVYSHLLFRVAGKEQHVLSRVANAGFDYSQRTNKLAHHVVLDRQELAPAGPAWALSQSGFMETAWTGTPRILPVGRPAPKGDRPLKICTEWQKAVGDAGWAGVLAQQSLQGSKIAYLIFPEGMEVLPLIEEALSLLPPARRWEVSFSTFFTRLPQGVECAWRCVLVGSAEAQAAVVKHDGLIIDLTRELGAAPESEFAVAARTGKPVTAKPQIADLQTAASSPPPFQGEDDFVALGADDELRLGPPDLGSGKKLLGPPKASGKGPPKLPSQTRRKRRVALIAGLLAIAVCLVVGAVGYAALQGRNSALVKKENDKREVALAEADQEKDEKASTVDNKAELNPSPPQTPSPFDTQPNKGKKLSQTTPSPPPSSSATSEKSADPSSTSTEAALPPGNKVENGPPSAPAEPGKVSTGEKKDVAPTPKANEAKVEANSFKWPIEPVFPAAPSIEVKNENLIVKSQVLMDEKSHEGQRVTEILLIGSLVPTGKDKTPSFTLSQEPLQERSWTIYYNPSGNNSPRVKVASVEYNQSDLAITWEGKSVKQNSSALSGLSMCALLVSFQDGSEKVIPFSFLRQGGMRLSIRSWSEGIYCPESVTIKELCVVDVSFGKAKDLWVRENQDAGGALHDVSFRYKSRQEIGSYVTLERLGSKSVGIGVEWSLAFGEKKLDTAQLKKAKKEILALNARLKDVTENRESIRRGYDELDRQIRMLRAKGDVEGMIGLESTKQNLDLQKAGLEKDEKKLFDELQRLGLDVWQVAYVQKFVEDVDDQTGELSCFVVRRVSYAGKDIFIPLVRIGGDSQ